jgi:ABC-type uncharacterized transport system permease subunit
LSHDSIQRVPGERGADAGRGRGLCRAGRRRLAAERRGRARGLLAAWLLHALRWPGAAGRPPRFGFAPALSVTAWLVLTVYAVEAQCFPQLQARWALAALGARRCCWRWSSRHAAARRARPGCRCTGRSASPSYGLFAAAVVHAWLMTRAERTIRHAPTRRPALPLLTLERLTFRFATAGFVLLSATLLAGVFFSEVLYGRAWRWDHKTVFSVLSWAAFALLLLGRGPLRLARAQGRARDLRRLACSCCWPTSAPAS